MKKFLALLLCLALITCLFAGCGNKKEEAPAPAKTDTPAPAATPKQDIAISEGNKTATVGTEQTVTEETKYKDSITVICDNTQMSVLDPANSAAGGQGSVMNFNCIHDTLVGNDNGTVVPELATSWETDDYQNFTFHLREDVKFHNGEPLTADDVAFTVEHAKAAMGGTAYTRCSYIDEVEIVDDYTFIFHLNQVNTDFIYYLYSPNLSILNREACEKDPEKGTYIGTGAWIVEDFVSNEYSQLVVNEDYWGEVPNAKRLRFIKVAEEATRYMMLINDEVDVAFGCSPADFDSIRDDPNFNLYTYVICNVGFVGFNMADPVTSDINFRLCVAHLIDRAAIIAGTRYGYGQEPASGAFWGSSTMYRNMDLPTLDYDVEMAKEYLAKSNYNGETVELCSWVGEFKTICQILQSELINLGVNATFFETDYAGFSAHVKFGENKSQIISSSGGWSTYASSCTSFFTEGSSNNTVSYVNPEVVELLKKAGSTIDEAEKEACYKEAQRLVYEDVAYVPVMSIEHGVGCAKDVGGVILTSENMHDLSHVFRIVG